MDTPATAPVEQQQPQQQAQANPTPAQSVSPEGFIEMARYNGLVRKVEELTLTNRSLNEQLVAKSSELEQLKGQLSIKDTEKSVALSERDKQLQTVLQESQGLASELEALRALKIKVDVINELGRPELLKIADRLPSMTDPEALKIVFQDFAGFADDMVKAREKQLMAGITPGIGAPALSGKPASRDAWLKEIEKAPLGSQDRKRLMDDYGDWLEQNAQMR